MKDYVIVTDATADLPAEEYEKHGAVVVPMEFILNNKPYTHYIDSREISFDEFYERVASGEDIHTSQINVETYLKTFTPILEEGKDILYICFTSGLSGTYESAVHAAKLLQSRFEERRIIVIDSLCASIGEGYLVWLAMQEKEKGLSLDELAKWVTEHRRRVRHWFIVDNFDQLKKGGRVSKTTALLGTALNIKPMLSVDDEGKLITVAKIRGSSKVIDAFKKRLEEDQKNYPIDRVLIGHASNINAAKQLEKSLLESGLVKDTMIADIGPVIGAHVGRGMYAFVYLAGD